MKLKFSAEVQKALENQWPIVALESTLVTHGFPFPDNLSIARESEDAVRASGATPATIAVINGAIHVGLSDAELEFIAKPHHDYMKATTRDLPVCMARKQTAGTTVAATMAIAAKAGIKLFATGGIGGVHRGVADTWDISADLTELSRTPVCVVCSGAKSLLDLPKTLEALETLGVPVIGYGTNELPAFYTHTSGLKLDARVDTPAEAASVLKAHAAIGAQNGILVCNPIDASMGLPKDEIERHIEAGLKAAELQGVGGKAATPFLLKYIVSATQGRTVEPNKALIRANAVLAAKVAVEYAKT
ncbi:MAG: pseudouridine-5'-phosphate glycosidase [Alphaproteobacteria bacterium]|nr:pseudouridine-5'-phosphate glycosidase [Alphaproteobacteria bacterium]